MFRRVLPAFCRSSLSILVSLWLLGSATHCTRTDKTRAEKTSSQLAHVESSSEPESERATPTAKKVYTPPPPISSGQQARCIVPSPQQAPRQAFPAERCPDDPTGPLALPYGTVSFPDAPGKPELRVELAREQESRTRGLMYRTDLSQDQGMLFTWREAQLRSFWMKNTCLPLDMLFIDDEGYIVGILENVPTLNLAARRVRCPAQHVLEVNAGWTRSHGVFAGQKLLIEE
jgi:hypothetical protein